MEHIKNFLEVRVLQYLLDSQHTQILNLRKLHQIWVGLFLIASHMAVHQVHVVMRRLKACDSKPEKNIA